MTNDGFTRRTALGALTAPILLGNDSPNPRSANGPPSADQRIVALRSSGGRLTLENTSTTQTLRLTGPFPNGLTFDGGGMTMVRAAADGDGIFVGNEPGSIANAYFNKLRLQDFNLVGPGDGADGNGIKVAAGADMVFDTFRVEGFKAGILLNGGLDLNFLSPTLIGNGIGLQAAPYFAGKSGGLHASLGSNANNFFGIRLWKNGRAIAYDNFANTAINFFGGTIEANNLRGTTTDGSSASSFTKAGIVNMIGIHSESNRGQFGYFYSGNDSSKVFVSIGNEIIDDVDTNFYVEKGTLCSIGSRIYNHAAARYVHINDGAYATLIDSDTVVTGDLSHVVSIRFGRITFGANAVASGVPIYIGRDPIAAAGNVAVLLRRDTCQIQAQDDSGKRTGYIQFSTANHALSNTNPNGGWAIQAANATVLWAGRSGAKAIEPGFDKAVDLGSASLRFRNIYAQTGAISTSDGREKQQVRELSDQERAAAKRCKALLRAFKFNDSVERKGKLARIHFGIVAQEVIAAFAAEGLDAHNYALLCHDEYAENDDAHKPGDRYGIRYEELLAFIISAV